MRIYAEDDFAGIVDELEPLTLLRRGGDPLELPDARRFSQKCLESAETAGGVIATEWLWDIAWPDGQRPPMIGDKLRDAEGWCGVLVGLETLGPSRRLRCQVREVSFNPRLAVLVQIEEAILQDLGSGLEVTGWRVVFPAVMARVQPVSIAVDHEQSPPTSEQEFDITLAIDDDLNENHRIIGPNGVEYRIDRFLPAKTVASLPVVEATLLTSSS